MTDLLWIALFGLGAFLWTASGVAAHVWARHLYRTVLGLDPDQRPSYSYQERRPFFVREPFSVTIFAPLVVPSVIAWGVSVHLDRWARGAEQRASDRRELRDRKAAAYDQWLKTGRWPEDLMPSAWRESLFTVGDGEE